MSFIEGQTYYFNPRDQKGTPRGRHPGGVFGMVYLRHVGKVDLFQSPGGGWLRASRGRRSGTTRSRKGKAPLARGLPKEKVSKSGRSNARTHSNTGGLKDERLQSL